MQNLWQPFGLRSTPFFDQPLEPSRQGAYPITLYVERGGESRLLNRIASSDNSASVVESLPGGGKTTLINYVKFTAAENGYVVSPSHVRVTSKFTYRDFALETLTNILRPLVNANDQALRSKAVQNTAIKEAMDLVNQMSQGGGGWSVDVQGGYAGATGGLALSRGAPPRDPPPIENARLFSLTRAVAAAVRDDLGFKGTVIHVNNLELAAIGDAEWPSILFNDIRDFLQIPGVHFVIGASRGFVASHLSVHPRVSSILQHPVDLPPLSAPQVQGLLEKRYQNLSIPKTGLVEPVERTTVERMHSTFNGDLRAMFSALEDAMERRLVVEARPMAFDEVVTLLRDEYREATIQDLPRAAKGAVDKLASMPRPFSQSDLNRVIKKSQPRISQIFSQLQALDIIVQIGGTKPYQYDFSGKAKIALGLLPT